MHPEGLWTTGRPQNLDGIVDPRFDRQKPHPTIPQWSSFHNALFRIWIPFPRLHSHV